MAKDLSEKFLSTKNSKIPFVIVSSGRSGSTSLAIWLNSHELIRCHSEILIRDGYDDLDGLKHWIINKFGKWFYHSIFNSPLLRIKTSLTSKFILNPFLFDLMHCPTFCAPIHIVRNNCNFQINEKFNNEAAVGFMIQYGALNQIKILSSILKKKGFRIIHLIRKDSIDKYVSWEIASRYNIYHQKGKIQIEKFLLEKRKLEAFHKKEVFYIKKFRKMFSSNLHYQEIFYEDFFGKNESIRKSIFNFLNVEPESLPIKSHKINSSVEDLVINVTELSKWKNESNFIFQ